MFELDGFEAGRRAARALALLAALLAPGLAAAQIPPQRPETAQPEAPAPAEPPPLPAPAPPVAGTGLALLSLGAQFANDRKPIRSGLNWRVLAEAADGSAPRIVARSASANPSFSLPPGSYVVHAAYGFASGTRRITLGPQGLNDQVAISAGAWPCTSTPSALKCAKWTGMPAARPVALACSGLPVRRRALRARVRTPHPRPRPAGGAAPRRCSRRCPPRRAGRAPTALG